MLSSIRRNADQFEELECPSCGTPLLKRNSPCPVCPPANRSNPSRTAQASPETAGRESRTSLRSPLLGMEEPAPSGGKVSLGKPIPTAGIQIAQGSRLAAGGAGSGRHAGPAERLADAHHQAGLGSELSIHQQQPVTADRRPIATPAAIHRHLPACVGGRILHIGGQSVSVTRPIPPKSTRRAHG